MSGSLCHIDIGIVLIWSRTATNEVAEQSIYRFVTNVRMPLTLSYIKQFTQCLPQVTHYFITELDYLHPNNSWLLKRFTSWHGSTHLLSKAREGQWTINLSLSFLCYLQCYHEFEEIIKTQRGIPKWKVQGCLSENWITVNS